MFSINRFVNVVMIAGIESIPTKTPMCLTLQSDGNLEIKQRFFGKQPLYLNYSQITNAEIINEKEIIECDKSVLGRAVVGGILLGPLGAIVGGMDGIGTKKKTEFHSYFVINYNSNESNEPKALSFQDQAGNFIGMMKAFISELRENAGLPQPQEQSISNIL